MRTLLDVKVLVALLDPEHSFHERAHAAWREILESGGWSSCPITQNGVLRILSNERYPGASSISKAAVFSNLAELIENSNHVFWPDEISLLDNSRFNPDAIIGHRQLTDIYLLGLAMQNDGRFATFDRRIPPNAIVDSSKAYLWII